MDHSSIVYQKEQSAIYRKQIEKENLGLKGNVLILSDRLIILAYELFLSIERITEAHVIGIISNCDDIRDFVNYNIDYLIIAGYLKNEKNYEIINRLRINNSNMKTVQWAGIDGLIKDYCLRYKIFFCFDKHKPVHEFLQYLIKIEQKYDALYFKNP